ncbi:hypothetical protein IWQ61_002048 [Dispira simplex]|nr:hypothetical protein IWQ61_002048 [Dispira simplex]
MLPDTVSTFLQEPIFQTPGNKRKRLTQRILQITGQLELLLNRDHQTDYVQMMVMDERADKLTRLLKTLIAEHDEQNRPLQSYFQETGFAELFPYAMSRLSLEPNMTGKHTQNTGIHGHFQHFTTLNQLVNICIQLRHDVDLENHRFIPHQLAVLYVFRITNPLSMAWNLLYFYPHVLFNLAGVMILTLVVFKQQCLGTAGVEYKKYKARVEMEFDKVKAYLAGESSSSPTKENHPLPETLTRDIPNPLASATFVTRADRRRTDTKASEGRARLSEYHREWLQGLTSDIIVEALYKKGPIRHASRPLAKVLDC